MAEIHPDNERPGAPGSSEAAQSADAASNAARLDRRSFLRALSGSALTVVAGGLTITLAACEGASTSNPIIASNSVTAIYPSLPGGPSGSSGVLGSITSNPSGSAGSNSSSSSSYSSGSVSSGSNSSTSSTSLAVPPAPGVRRQAIASLRPQEYHADGWSTRV